MKKSFFLISLLSASIPARAGVEISQWSSTYKDGKTINVQALLEFQGDHGLYYPSGKEGGRLSDITYFPQEDGVVRVEGKWSYGGVEGWFMFRVARDRQGFSGVWGYTNQKPSGSWDGTALSLPPPAKEIKNDTKRSGRVL